LALEHLLGGIARAQLSEGESSALVLAARRAAEQENRTKSANQFATVWSRLSRLRPAPAGRPSLEEVGPVPAPVSAGEVGVWWWLGSPVEHMAMARQLDNAWARLVAAAAGTPDSDFVRSEQQAWALDSAKIQGSLFTRLWASTGRVLDAWQERYGVALRRVSDARGGAPLNAPPRSVLQRREPSFAEDMGDALRSPAAGLAGLGALVVIGGLLFLFAKKGR
jgi:hypothetical protein